jgi:phage terminase large subunit-like protein
MVRVSPHLHRADHFRVYAGQLELAVGGGLRLVFAAPPQHGKTQVTLHGLAWLILRYPDKRHAYITYSQWRARSVARIVKRILAAAGVLVTGTLDQMALPGGGQCLFTSIDGGITGEPVDGVAIIDDPFKNRKEADSSTRREVVEDSYRQAIETRIHPGASCFVLATRWHPRDLSGVLIGEGWSVINLPAIAENDNDPNGRANGEALFPALWPLESLLEKKRKVGDFTWEALYQGRPRPKGGKVFHAPTFYSKLPTEGYRGALGVDLSYTAKTTADWSICLELLREDRFDRNGNPIDPLYYVREVNRAQVEAPEFTLTLKARHVKRPHWRMLWRASGTEKGSAQFIKERGIPLHVEQPPGDKLVSATAVAADWNAGLVMVPDPEHFPESEVWLYAFLDVIQNFTGSGKEPDDDVDALGNAHKALQGDNDHSVVTAPSSRH